MMATAKQYHRILMALDGSTQSSAAVQYLVDFFPPETLRPVLLHIRSRIQDYIWDWASDHGWSPR